MAHKKSNRAITYMLCSKQARTFLYSLKSYCAKREYSPVSTGLIFQLQDRALKTEGWTPNKSEEEQLQINLLSHRLIGRRAAETRHHAAANRNESSLDHVDEPDEDVVADEEVVVVVVALCGVATLTRMHSGHTFLRLSHSCFNCFM